MSPLIMDLKHIGTRIKVLDIFETTAKKKNPLEMIQSSIVINRLLFCCIHCSVYMFFFRLC